jgi:uncharacterized protein
MHSMSSRFLVFGIVIVVFLLLDSYVYQGIKTILNGQSDNMRRGGMIAYWMLTAATVGLLLTFSVLNPEHLNSIARNFMITFLFANLLFKLLFGSFLLLEDVYRIGHWVLSLFASPSPSGQGTMISRSKFISSLGIIVASVPFLSVVYGVLKGAHDYRVKNIKISLKNLPSSFHGLKIMQLSDIHAGSFMSHSLVSKGIDLAMAQKADVVFFTGDLVNNTADELEEYKTLFSKIKAPMGVYSVLGNHDYGDYVSWPSAEAKIANLTKLVASHKEMGWDILINEHRVLERGEDKIGVIGIENWGAKGRFPKYGKMKDALKDIDHVSVKLLLSHDPSHWDAQVIPEYSDIDVMFAGHTHGFQFGVEVAGIKWSPVKYMYEQWAGLYQKGQQYLYVNRGFGYLGLPGRIGMPPEITVIELLRA